MTRQSGNREAGRIVARLRPVEVDLRGEVRRAAVAAWHAGKGDSRRGGGWPAAHSVGAVCSPRPSVLPGCGGSGQSHIRDFLRVVDMAAVMAESRRWLGGMPTATTKARALTAA